MEANRDNPALNLHTTRNRLVKGFATGVVIAWLIGVVYVVSLNMYFYPPETEMPDSRRLVSGMICVFVPWGVVGGFVGTMIGWWGGWLETIATFIGVVAALIYSLTSRPTDGWLFMTMPFDCCIGAFIGLAAGGAFRLVHSSR